MEAIIDWWQQLPLNVKPYLFKIGIIQLRWYSLGYVFAFLTTFLLVRYRLKRKESNFRMSNDDVEISFIYIVIGLIVGARLGYVFFYGFGDFITRPFHVISPIRFDNGIKFVGISGMSYHGGVIGTIIGCWLYTKRHKRSFFDMMDLFLPAVPLAYTFGRLGNFMNGELYGRMTESSWGMYFFNRSAGKPFEYLRHPSQLYEAFGEGILLFIILWSIRNLKMPRGYMGPFYLMGYGLARYIIEFYRQPDAIFKNPGDNLGTVLSFMTMGQVLCGIMFFSGLGLLIFLKKREDNLLDKTGKKYNQAK